MDATAELDLSAFRTSEAALFTMTGEDCRFRQVTPGFARLLGRSEEELRFLSMFELLHPGDFVGTLLGINRVEDGAEESAFENRFRHSDGSFRSLAWVARRVPGEPVIYAMAREITRERALEQELAATRTLLDVTLGVHGSGSWEWSIQDDLITLDARAVSLLGIGVTSERMTTHDLAGFVASEDGQDLSGRLADAMSDTNNIRLGLDLRDDRVSSARLSLVGRVLERDTRGRAQAATGVVWSAQAERDLEQQLLELVSKDALTGLHNRRAFDQALRSEWRNAARMANSLGVVMVDIDNFKAINDTRGHLAGDEAIAATARALESVVRSRLDLVARWGGEEFALLLPDTTASEARAVAERAVAAVRPLGLTVTAGAAVTAPTGAQRPEELLQRADDALYRGKRSGKDCAVSDGTDA